MRKLAYTPSYKLGATKTRGRRHWNAWTGSSYNNGKSHRKVFKKKRGRKRKYVKHVKATTKKVLDTQPTKQYTEEDVCNGILGIFGLFVAMVVYIFGTYVFNLLFV